MLLWEQGLQSLTDSIRTQSLASSREGGVCFPRTGLASGRWC